MRVFARNFLIQKLELKQSASTTCSVYSEYLRFHFSLTGFILHSAFDPKLLKTIENVVRSKQNLVRFKLFNLVSASYAFNGVLFDCVYLKKCQPFFDGTGKWNSNFIYIFRFRRTLKNRFEFCFLFFVFA